MESFKQKNTIRLPIATIVIKPEYEPIEQENKSPKDTILVDVNNNEPMFGNCKQDDIIALDLSNSSTEECEVTSMQNSIAESESKETQELEEYIDVESDDDHNTTTPSSSPPQLHTSPIVRPWEEFRVKTEQISPPRIKEEPINNIANCSPQPIQGTLFILENNISKPVTFSAPSQAPVGRSNNNGPSNVTSVPIDNNVNGSVPYYPHGYYYNNYSSPQNNAFTENYYRNWYSNMGYYQQQQQRGINVPQVAIPAQMNTNTMPSSVPYAYQSPMQMQPMYTNYQQQMYFPTSSTTFHNNTTTAPRKARKVLKSHSAMGSDIHSSALNLSMYSDVSGNHTTARAPHQSYNKKRTHSETETAHVNNGIPVNRSFHGPVAPAEDNHLHQMSKRQRLVVL